MIDIRYGEGLHICICCSFPLHILYWKGKPCSANEKLFSIENLLLQLVFLLRFWKLRYQFKNHPAHNWPPIVFQFSMALRPVICALNTISNNKGPTSEEPVWLSHSKVQTQIVAAHRRGKWSSSIIAKILLKYFERVVLSNCHQCSQLIDVVSDHLSSIVAKILS